MSDHIVINISMDRKCSKCGKKGATESGVCLNCVAKHIAALTKAQKLPKRERGQ